MIQSTECRNILCASEYYDFANGWDITPNYNCVIKGATNQGSFSKPIFTRDISDTQTFVSSSNYYWAEFAGTGVTTVIDRDTSDLFGDEVVLKNVSSVSEVNSTQNTWYRDRDWETKV